MTRDHASPSQVEHCAARGSQRLIPCQSSTLRVGRRREWVLLINIAGSSRRPSVDECEYPSRESVWEKLLWPICLSLCRPMPLENDLEVLLPGVCYTAVWKRFIKKAPTNVSDFKAIGVIALKTDKIPVCVLCARLDLPRTELSGAIPSPRTGTWTVPLTNRLTARNELTIFD